MGGYSLTDTRKLPSDWWTVSIVLLVLLAGAVTVVVWPVWVAGVYLLVWPVMMYAAGRRAQYEFTPDRVRRG